MIAVLIDSVRKGSSAKVAVRRSQKVRVSGLGDDDVVRVLFFDEAGAYTPLVVIEDGDFFIVEGTVYIQAHHDRVGRGRVNVDLVR